MILKLGESGPIAPWRLLFLIEGFPAVIVATFAWRVIPDSPERTSYLTAREKLIARQRLVSPGDDYHHQHQHRTAPKPSAGVVFDSSTVEGDTAPGKDSLVARCAGATVAVLLDPVAWTTAAIFFLTNMAFASLPVFLPAILTQMGHSPLTAQALAAPPYLVSFLVVLAAAAASDALRSRARLIAAAALCSSAGYGFLAVSHRLGGGGGGEDDEMLNMARYLAVYPAAVGFFCVVVLTISWNVNNARPVRRESSRGGGGHHKGAAFALMQAVGQCGPLVGVRLYPETDAPWFTRGMGVCAAAMLGVAVLALGLRAYLARENRRMDEQGRTGGEGDGAEEEEMGLVGGGRTKRGRSDDGFRYML